MPDDASIITFPAKSTLRLIQGLREAASGEIRIVETASAGSYDFAEREPAERVEITAGIRRVYAVRVDGAVLYEFNTATNAIRALPHVKALVELGVRDLAGDN